MADNDVGGQLATLIQILTSETWRELWQDLGLTVESFESLGLKRTASDVVVWETCQAKEVVLVTANRNDDGPDSLAAAIRDQNGPGSLPVFTLANADRVQRSRSYAEQVAEQLLGYLMDIDQCRGAGRLWLP